MSCITYGSTSTTMIHATHRILILYGERGFLLPSSGYSSFFVTYTLSAASPVRIFFSLSSCAALLYFLTYYAFFTRVHTLP